MKTHPSEDVLEDLLLSLDRRGLAILEHLVGCASCRARFEFLPRPERPPLEGEVRFGAPNYDRVLAEVAPAVKAFERALREERDAAPGLFLELTEASPERRERLVAGRRFRKWGVAELLVERSLEESSRDSAYGEELGLLALRLAERLDASLYGAGRIEDLRAQAWAHVGNARRLRFDFQGAEEAFGQAFSHLAKGTQDALERAVLLDLEASLRRDQRRFEEAFELLRQAVEIFLDYGERHRAGRSFVKLATVHHHSGNPAEGIPLLHQALGMIDPEQEPRLLLCVRHIHREALAALSFLQQALAGEAVGTEVVARVADYLKRAEHDPELRFHGGGA